MTMRMIFKKLFLFSPSQKKARVIEFTDGVNIITSSQEDGTDRGKSVIMRSLYHALGAEGCFDKKWHTEEKVYILQFNIDAEGYFIYRSRRLYKFFDSNKRLLFTSSSSRELSERLSEYTFFAVQLPNRGDKLEITPPVYNYLPFYLDQDHYNGNDYSSFRNLGQYKNFKENVLFYHLGAYNECYFQLIKERESLKEYKSENEAQINLYHAILDNLDKRIGGVTFSSDYEAMKRDISLFQTDYAILLNKLADSKKKLVDLRNGLFETSKIISELDKLKLDGRHKINKLIAHICTECGSKIEDTVLLKSKQYNIIEDAIVIKNDLQSILLDDQQKIEKEEQVYNDLLERMEIYKKKIEAVEINAENVLKQKSMVDFRGDIVSDIVDYSRIIKKIDDQLEDMKKQIKEYNKKKKEIERSYYNYMATAKDKFGINELDTDTFKKLTNTVKASGSNKNVVTIMWYIAILELRRKFNNAAISFPVVFDSINNVETDNEKKYGLLQYVVEKCNGYQLILSSLGHKDDDVKTDRQINIISLKNDKYQLLNTESYESNKRLLGELCDAEK